MFPVAPDDVMPAVEPMPSVPPEAKLNVPLLPSRTFVPIFRVDPLFTVKFIPPDIVAALLVKLCAPDLAKFQEDDPDALRVSVPPDILKLPDKFMVEPPLLLLRSKVPPP